LSPSVHLRPRLLDAAGLPHRQPRLWAAAHTAAAQRGQQHEPGRLRAPDIGRVAPYPERPVAAPRTPTGVTNTDQPDHRIAKPSSRSSPARSHTTRACTGTGGRVRASVTDRPGCGRQCVMHGDVQLATQPAGCRSVSHHWRIANRSVSSQSNESQTPSSRRRSAAIPRETRDNGRHLARRPRGGTDSSRLASGCDLPPMFVGRSERCRFRSQQAATGSGPARARHCGSTGD
jgi:hypothetical protein